MLGDLIVWWALSSLILITMNSGRGHCAWWQFCKVPNQTHREIENWKMYAIKQIKICAEYRDMLPRPRLDLSGTPGLRPIGLSPGSWQTSLGLGSMSRYSAQILICITVCQEGITTPHTPHCRLILCYTHQQSLKPLTLGFRWVSKPWSSGLYFVSVGFEKWLVPWCLVPSPYQTQKISVTKYYIRSMYM